MHNSDETELNEREASNAVNQTIRITTRVIEAAAPRESYWPGYHARLREKLNETREPNVAPASGPSWIRRLFQISVPIPVPVAVAIVLVFMLTLLLARATNVPHVQIVHVPVEVPVEIPVVKEKVVTRVVYRETTRKPRQSSPAQTESTFARTLSGFKPTEEINLTVIKGGANEK